LTSILFEGRDIFRPGGTGIATYARGLNRRARELGYETRMLASSESAINPKEPILSEIQFFDASIPKRSTFDIVGRWARSLTAATVGLSPAELVLTGAVVDPSNEAPVPKQPDWSGESGRGLQIVAALSHVWGWSPIAGHGKAVWAVLRDP